MDAAEYRVRQHAFEKERVWRVGPEGLSWDGGDEKGHFPFHDIRAIRLSFTPTRFDFIRYRCSVTRFNGWREEIVSTSYAGIGSFEDRAQDYGRFVRELVTHATKGNPAIRFETGESPLKYWGNIAILAGGIALLAFVLISIGFIPTWIIMAKLAVIACLIPLCLKWIGKNRPAVFQPNAIPSDLLPEVSLEHGQ